MPTRARFLGLDLTSSQMRPSACIVLDEELSLAFSGFLTTDTEIVQTLQSHRPCLVAIDAPLGLPQGLCCLEEACSCHPRLPAKGRSCERELARLGIPCYFTTKKSIIKPMVYRAISLKSRLELLGCQVLEVYPYATKVCLFGKPIPPKSKPAGLAFLRGRLAALIPRLSPYVATFSHDLSDAVLAAYTAYLYHQGKAELLGEPEEAMICIPSPATP